MSPRRAALVLAVVALTLGCRAPGENVPEIAGGTPVVPPPPITASPAEDAAAPAPGDQAAPGPGDAAAPASDDAAAPAPGDAAAPAPPDPDGVTTTTDGWVRLAPPGLGFTVELPSKPERQTSEVKGPQGHAAQLVQYTLARDDGVLIVSTSPLVAQLVEHGNKDLALDRTLASQTDLPGRTVRYKKPITLGDAIGREAEVDLEIEGQTARMRIRMYLQGAHLFQALAMWPATGDAGAPDLVERFYRSFVLTGDTSAGGAAIDLWQRFEVPELGLTVLLPKKPEYQEIEADNFLGAKSFGQMSAVTSFPPSTYTIEAVALSEALAAEKDEALIARWTKAMSESSPDRKIKVVKSEEGELLGIKGRRMLVKATTTEGSGDGYLVAIVDRSATPPRMLVGSMWALDPSAGEAEAKRFNEGIARAAK